MTQKRLVTAIIPTIGRDELRRSVDSVLTQTVECEVIVCIDLETSPALDWMEKWQGRVRVFATGGIGSAGARNFGVQKALTRYVAFLDDDDWWEPTKVELQLAALNDASPHAISVTQSYFHRPNGSISTVPRRGPETRSGTLASYIVTRRHLRYGDSFIQTSSILASRSALLIHPWDTRLQKHEDWDLMVRLVDEHDYEVMQVDLPLVHVQQASTGSLSRMRAAASSLLWWRRYEALLTPRASADFILTQVVRSALADRDYALARRALSSVRGLPHLAAVVLASAGFIGR